MRNKEYLKRNLFNILITIIVFLIVFLIVTYIEYNQYKKNFNYKLSAILELIESNYPDIEKEELIIILNSKNNKENILAEYGYDIEEDFFIEENNKVNLKYSFIKFIILLITFIIIIYIFVKSHLINDKEIEKIIKCIEKINQKNYELNLDELSEDRLSILKEEIYKTTIMLKESAENSLKDKINLKNSLQDISHQLKTPLTSINILLDNLIEDIEMDKEVRQKFINQIKKDITNITFLVESILKLSKFDANAVFFNEEEVIVEELVSDIIKKLSSLSDLKDIDIEVSNKCKNKLICDFRWQVEALANILKNAIEYSDNGSKVIIECSDNELYTQIKIKDNGKGMDEEDLRNIFKRFYKGKNSSKDSVGIGLALAKVIIEKDNGQVIVKSKRNKGTVFTIKYFYDR